MPGQRLRFSPALGNDDSSQRVLLQHHLTHLASEVLIVSVFEPFKALTVNPRESQDMGQ